jgi:glycosyltransferase involved in cell wall biosynthesis
MKSQKILVTICNYNHSLYLQESIASIQNQTYENLDICIYDDGSDDLEKVKSICENLKSSDPRIRTIYSDSNKGKWHGLNESIKSSGAEICTSHDADDISLKDRLEMQYNTLTHTNTVHNLCGFHHCWSEDDVKLHNKNRFNRETDITVIAPESVLELVKLGASHPKVNHYFTGEFETAGVTSMFLKPFWDLGIRFQPPGLGLRTLLSEDSDFNFRMTTLFQRTSVTAEKLYLYRRNTSTNTEEI